MKTNERTTTYTDRDPIKVDEPVSPTGHAGGAKPSTTPEPNNGNTIVKVIACLFVVGIILTAIIF